MTDRDKVLVLDGTLEVALGIARSGHTDVDKIRMIETTIGDLWGCTDKNAANWKEGAIYDDGSCIYTAVEPPEG